MQIFNEIDKISLFKKRCITCITMEEMRFFYILYDIWQTQHAKKKLIELAYQLQLFDKKIISTYFKTCENAFIMQQKPHGTMSIFLEIYKR